MEKITTTAQLKNTILLLELKQKMEYELLKDQVRVSYDQLKPVNILKNMLQQAVAAPDLKNNLVNSVMGVAAGYLSKKAAVGSTHNPIKNLLGTLLQMTVTGIVARNGNGIKSGISNLVRNFLNNRKQIKDDYTN